MPRFRKIPVVIDAIRFLEDDVIPLEFREAFCQCDEAERMHIHTLEGLMMISPGDWIIKGVVGEFYPIKAAVFLQTYEPADDVAHAYWMMPQKARP